MKPVRVAVVILVVALGCLLGCSGKEAAIKQCNEQCDKAIKDAEVNCVGAGAETCKSVVRTNAAACTKSCAAAEANGGRYKIRW